MATDHEKAVAKINIRHPGAMTAAAKREGLTNAEYEKKHQHDKGHSGQMARFAINAKKFKHTGY